MKTYPVKLGVSDGMPTSLFDPRWRDPEVAARVAFTLYCRNDFADARAPLQRSLAVQKSELTDARSFALTHVHDVDAVGAGARATRFKGGLFGELHRHYAMGNGSLNFHAQAVAFGVDDAGRFFLNATVGRFDGPWGNDAILSVRFFAGTEELGAVSWIAALDPVGDKRVREAGVDARLAERFPAIDRAEVTFTARHGKDAQAPAPIEEGKSSPRLSRARRSVVVKGLAAALALTDKSARATQVKKLLEGVVPEEARALVKEADPRADVAAVMALLS